MFKRVLCSLVLMLMVLTGCTRAQVEQLPAIPQEDAQALLESFLQAQVEGDFDRAFAMIHPDRQHIGWARSDWQQWAIAKSSPVPEGWLFETREHLRKADGHAVRTAYRLVVSHEGKLWIDDPYLLWYREKGETYATVATQVHPLREDPSKLEIVHGGMVEQVAVIAPQLPDQFWPHLWGLDTPELPVARDWGLLALSPDTRRIAFVTQGKHAFLGITDWEGKVQPLDHWFEGRSRELAWSWDGKYLAAVAGQPSGAEALQVWDLAISKLHPTVGVPQGPGFPVSDLQWRGHLLHFRINGESWVYDPASGTAKKA